MGPSSLGWVCHSIVSSSWYVYRSSRCGPGVVLQLWYGHVMGVIGVCTVSEVVEQLAKKGSSPQLSLGWPKLILDVVELQSRRHASRTKPDLCTHTHTHTERSPANCRHAWHNGMITCCCSCSSSPATFCHTLRFSVRCFVAFATTFSSTGSPLRRLTASIRRRARFAGPPASVPNSSSSSSVVGTKKGST